MSSQGDFDLVDRRIGEAKAQVQRRHFSDLIARHTSMTQMEVYHHFRDREEDLIRELRGEYPTFLIRLLAQEVIVETIIEMINESIDEEEGDDNGA